MSKKGVIMYYDLIEQLSDFNDKDFRDIIVAMMEYDKNGTEPNFDGMKKVAFKFIKTTIDKNNDDYNKKCEKNRENAISKWGKIQNENENFDDLTLKQKNSRLRRERLKNAIQKGTHTEQEWEEMKAFFNNKCVRCGNDGIIVKDHIIPIYMGGSNGLDNIQPLCKKCNSSKGADTTDYRELYCAINNIDNPYKSVCERSNSLANVTDIDIDIDKDINIKKEIEKKKSNGAVAPALTEIFDYWNLKNIIKHKELNEQTGKAIKNALKEFGEEQIKTAIDRYNQVIKDTNYYFDTKWTLCEFLKQRNAMPDFLDNGSKWVNYTQRGGKKVLKQQEYTQQDYDGVFDTFRNMA